MRRRHVPTALRQDRRAVAASELAVCLPVLVLLVLAMIEACTMIFLKQSLSVAAYEGIRTAIEPGATATDIEATCNAILADRRVKGGTTVILPANFTTLPRGDYISVTVSAPASSNSATPGSFFKGKTLSATASMMKEF